MSIHFHYDSNADAVVLLNSNNLREGGHLARGEGAFGHPLEAFKAAAYGRVIAEGDRHRLISEQPQLRLASLGFA